MYIYIYDNKSIHVYVYRSLYTIKKQTKQSPSSHSVSHISCALIPVGRLFEINICAIATAVGCGEVEHGLQHLQQAGDRQVLMKVVD